MTRPLAAYRAFVRKNGELLAQLESAAQGLTWLLPDRFAGSELGLEAVSSVLGLVTVLNDSIRNTDDESAAAGAPEQPAGSGRAAGGSGAAGPCAAAARQGEVCCAPRGTGDMFGSLPCAPGGGGGGCCGAGGGCMPSGPGPGGWGSGLLPAAAPLPLPLPPRAPLGPQSTSAVLLTIIQQMEVLAEMAAEQKYGPEHKWGIVAAIESLKAILRLLLLRRADGRVLIDGGAASNPHRPVPSPAELVAARRRALARLAAVRAGRARLALGAAATAGLTAGAGAAAGKPPSPAEVGPEPAATLFSRFRERRGLPEPRGPWARGGWASLDGPAGAGLPPMAPPTPSPLPDGAEGPRGPEAGASGAAEEREEEPAARDMSINHWVGAVQHNLPPAGPLWPRAGGGAHPAAALALLQGPHARDARAMVLAGEILNILRPPLYALALRRYGPRSWRPWLLSLALDAAAAAAAARGAARAEVAVAAGEPGALLSVIDSAEREELKRRKLAWLCYLLRSPMFDALTQRPLQAVEAAADPVPLLGPAVRWGSEILRGAQGLYFYTSNS